MTIFRQCFYVNKMATFLQISEHKLLIMNMIKITSCFIIGLLLLNSCKKAPQSRTVLFTTTTYDTLGNFDASGGMSNLLPRDAISPSLQNFMDTLLPEGVDLRKKHPELFTSSAVADIKITQSTTVYLTFISRHTKYYNSFGFYTYPTNNPPLVTADIKKITYVFPNAGQSSTLMAGDKVKLGTFEAGTSIGFVLLQDAWSMTNHVINNNAPHFCSADILNPEIDPNLKRHLVLNNFTMENKTLLSFEDTNRTDPTCDNDFNDLIFYCTQTP